MARTRARREILVIAPPTVAVRVIPSRPCPTRIFSSPEELRRWEEGEYRPTRALQTCVAEALRQIHCDPRQLSDRMAALLDWLSRQDHVPSLKAVTHLSTSERTFFRLWATEIPQPPARFLARLRALYAQQQQLLRGGATPAEAARLAGYRSARQMLHALEAWQ